MCTYIIVLVPILLSFFMYHCLFQPISLYHYHCQPVTITIFVTMPQSLSLQQCHYQCHNATITITLPQYMSLYINCTCLKYIPRNNHSSISFGSSTFTSYSFSKHWTFQEMSHMPQHNHGLFQDNHCDLCQYHHTICPYNHHDIYKKITNIHAMIIINCATTSIPISPSSKPRDKHNIMYKIHTFSRQQDGP